MNIDKKLDEFDKKFDFSLYYRNIESGVDTFTTVTEDVKDFLRQALQDQQDEIRQIVIEDVPHKYQKRLITADTQSYDGFIFNRETACHRISRC